MYAVKDWNEEVIKWMAVGMCLAIVLTLVIPMTTSSAWYALWKYIESYGNTNEYAWIAWQVSGALWRAPYTYAIRLIVAGAYGGPAGIAAALIAGAVIGL